jgi:hypothetical protein
MPQRAFKFYQRNRVVNINLNILAAGFLAIALAKFPVMFVGNWIGTEHKLMIAAAAYLIDTVIDVCVYYLLHWVANHWNPNGHLPKNKDRPKSRKFVHDATRIQAERMALVPIFIAIGPGGMWALDRFAGLQHSWAFVIAFATAIITTRILHTIWGYRLGTFKNTVDFVIDDDIQIGKDLSQEHEQSDSEGSR